MIFTKFQPNISSCSGEKVDFSGLGLFQQSLPPRGDGILMKF